jgi:hypothetical protein
MVDFNSPNLFTANKGDILNLVILGRRDELINTFQLWKEYCISNASSKLTMEWKLRASMFAIYLELAEPLERKFENKPEQLKELKEVVFTSDKVTEEQIIKAFRSINGFLDELNLIKIDTRKRFDTTDIEAENEEKEL